MEVAWGRPSETPSPIRATFLDAMVVFFPLAALLLLGLWMPAIVRDALSQAAAILGGAR